MFPSRGRRLGALTLSLAASAALAGPADAALVAAGPGDPVPAWYEDDTGLRLTECVGDPADGEEAVCPLPGDGEHLFWGASIEDLPIDSGTVSWLAEVAHADAAADDPVTPEDEAEEAHGGAAILIQGDNLVAGRTYTVTHPYGTQTAIADAQGRFDVEVAAEGAQAVRGPVGPFLRPAGEAGQEGELLGDPEVLGPVVGSPHGTNFVRVQSAGGAEQITRNFSVVAQVEQAASRGLASVGPAGLAFGERAVGDATGAQQAVSVANVGFAALAVSGATLSGAGAGDYSLVNGCLTPNVLGAGGACSISVAFAPSSAGARTATLTIPTDGANGDGSMATGSTHTVALSGAGAVPAPPAQAGLSASALRLLGLASGTANRPVLLRRVTVPSRLRLQSVRARGITLRLGPTSASRVLITIRRNGRPVYRRTVAAAGRIRLNARVLRRLLRTGRYAVQLTPIAASGQRGASIIRRLSISR